MAIGEIIRSLYQALLELVPVFRIVWGGTIAVGIVLLCIAYSAKTGSDRKTLSIVLGIIGGSLTVSAATQLIISLL